MTDLLARLCDACGKPIGGGYEHCSKCNIYLCFMCRLILQNISKEFPAKCPMCGGELNRKKMSLEVTAIFEGIPKRH